MFSRVENKFWLENPLNLLNNTKIIPLSIMNIESQMNAITRLVIVIFIILFLFNFNYSFLFLVFSLLIIIILFYIQRIIMKQYKKENFTRNTRNLHKNTPKNDNLTVFARDCFYCNDKIFGQEIPIEQNFNNPEFTSLNQKLAGPPNPRTKIAPVIAPPISDLGYWRANNLVNHSAVNKLSNVELYQSGYVITKETPEIDTSVRIIEPFNCLEKNYPQKKGNLQLNNIQEKSLPKNKNSVDIISTPIIENFNLGKNNVSGDKENFVIDRNSQRRSRNFSTRLGRKENVLNRAKNLSDGTEILANEPGWVNTACGYNPKQLLTSSLPTNLASGECSQNPRLREFNQNLFTQTIEPNVFTSNQINEPINSNIGISFTQQFPPLTCNENDKTDDLVFLERDPRIVDPTYNEGPELCPIDHINQSNIYDPRFTGYGTGYRSYNDENIGQTRFYYDDIDAIRMPNYIVRSKIDTQNFADKYGPIEAGNENGNIFTPEIRTLAETAFKQDAMQFRTDLQSRISRKMNRKMWQRRKAPINTQTCSSGLYGL